MEAIKKILGEDLFRQVSEKLTDGASLELVPKGQKAFLHKSDETVAVTNNGEWLPKEKFNEKLDEIKTLKSQTTEYAKELATLKKANLSATELQTQLAELQDRIKLNETEGEKRTAEIQKRFALKDALRSSGAKHPDLLLSKFDLNKIELEGEEIKNAKEIIEPIKNEYKDLFGEKKIAGNRINLDVDLPDGFVTREQFDSMTPRERVANIDKINESSGHWKK
jgi:hypothetical protein